MSTENMTNEELLGQAVARVSEKCKNDVFLQQLITTDSQLQELAKSSTSSLQFLLNACSLYAERPAIGYRQSEQVLDKHSGLLTIQHQKAFATMSYKQLWQTVSQVATGLASGHHIGRDARVGICGYAHLDYVLADFACLYLGATSVPLHGNVSSQDFLGIVNDAAIDTLFVDVDSVEQLLNVTSSIKKPYSIVVMNLDPRNELAIANFNKIRHKAVAAAPHLNIETMYELMANSAQLPVVAMNSNHDDKDRLICIMYTSGSTGTPKGALITEKIWYNYHMLSMLKFWDGVPYIWVNFMPFNHVMGRSGIIRGLLLGGVTYLTHRPDMSTLIEDMHLVRPTVMSLVPRIAIMLYQQFQLNLSRLSHDGNPQAREQLLAMMRTDFIGDRLVLATTGSAPLSEEHSDFIKECFKIPLYDNYGSTEAGLVTLNHHIRRENVSDYKLADVPELAYLGTDQPYPRGELRIKCRLGISGYLGDADASAALFDEDGFMKTGDIVELRGPDHVVWVDRMKNVIKLAQGEFVNTWNLESIFAGSSPAIEQIYLYGDSLRSYLVAVIVPSRETLQKYDGQDPAKIEELRLFVRKEIQRVAGTHKLRSFEVPRDFVVEFTPFSKANGLLTESNKSMHRKLKERYNEALEQLYAAIEAGQFPDMLAESASPDELVMNSIKAVLGFMPTSTSVNFLDMGGDSLDSVRLSGLIQQHSGVTIPVSMILSPSTTIGHWITFLTKSLQQGGNTDQLTFEKLHGKEPTLVYAKDLQLPNVFAPKELADAADLAPFAVGDHAKNVLLTGANGFLGRFLLSSLLEKLPVDGKLYCLVRATDQQKARERLLKGFAITMADQALVDQLSQDKRLVVLAGDLTLEKFGIGDALYHEITQTVDTIFHNGALVNHAFSYQQLFEPNVLGTIEIIRLALKGRLKKINFVSSVGVGAGLERDGMVMEDEDIRELWPARSMAPGYAAGYATSKWAAEVLLREFSELFKVPVNTFRCGMVLAHTKRKGHINAADFFSRLMMGLVNTSAAPKSFYSDLVTAQRAHFDGLPVDFIASSMSTIATHPSDGHYTYHVVNPHRDSPVSLDQVARWIRSAGYSLKASAHKHWYEVFEKRLKMLDDHRRGASPLPIIYQWQQPLSNREDIKLDTSKFVKKLQTFFDSKTTTFCVPNLSESYIHKCLRDLRALDLIDAPEEDRTSTASRTKQEAEQAQLFLNN